LTKLTMHRYIQSHCFASALVEQQHGGFAQTVCVLGLGGGALTGWLLKNLPSLSELTASELDEQVTQLATDYFGLDARDPRLTLRAGDGLEHMAEAKAQGRTFDLLVVDIGRSQSPSPRRCWLRHRRCGAQRHCSCSLTLWPRAACFR